MADKKDIKKLKKQCKKLKKGKKKDKPLKKDFIGDDYILFPINPDGSKTGGTTYGPVDYYDDQNDW